MKKINILWFKKDLRLSDNEALIEAQKDADILPLYIIEKKLWEQKAYSDRQWQFCKECLIELRTELEALGQPLVIRVGDVQEIFEEINSEFQIKGVYSHQETGDYFSFKRDQKILNWLRKENITWYQFLQFGVFRGNVNRNDWSNMYKKQLERELFLTPKKINPIDIKIGELPNDSFFNFDEDKCKGRLKGGRKNALNRLNYFFKHKITSYKNDISNPDKSFESCSRLSPYISWGCISLKEVLLMTKKNRDLDTKMFRSRLTWHCHFIQKLESEPELEFKESHPFYQGIRNENIEFLNLWSKGETGFPFIDACMRSLNHNGWINFRMRAMLMSFASYNLWIPWQSSGLVLARKFVDYEPGIHWNQCQMQSGTTSININRIYNPIKQSKDHDPNGNYIKKWIPELRDFPKLFIHEPWLIFDKNKYENLKFTNYMNPIIDFEKTTREARDKIKKITQKRGYSKISNEIYQKHGSRRKPFEKAKKSYSTNKKIQNVIQKELNFN